MNIDEDVLNMPICENAALAVIFRLHNSHGFSPFWLPKEEFPIKSLQYAVNEGFVLRKEHRGKHLLLEITSAGAKAVAGYRNYSGKRE
jgi:hypothetical protein